MHHITVLWNEGTMHVYLDDSLITTRHGENFDQWHAEMYGREEAWSQRACFAYAERAPVL